MKTKTIDIFGAIVFWEVGPCHENLLRAGLEPLGLSDLLPSGRSPKAILNEALNGLYAESKKLVRPLAKRAAFTVVAEERGEMENRYDSELRVEVNEEGAIDISPYSTAEYDKITKAYAACAAVVPTMTVTRILTAAISRLNGIPLRDRGAVYWLPNAKLEQWSKIANMIEAAAVQNKDAKPTAVHLMRTANDPDGIRAVKDGLLAELESELAAINTDVDNMELGPRALETREKQAARLLERLEEYKGIIGETMEGLSGKIEAAKTAAAEAVIMAAARSSMSPLNT